MNARNKKPKRIIFILVIVLVFLCTIMAAEGFLRLSFYQPGMLGRFLQFRKVDSLEVLPDYMLDDYGIMKLSPEGRRQVNNSVSKGKFELDINKLVDNRMLFDLVLLSAEFHVLSAGYSEAELERLGLKYEIDPDNLKIMEEALKNGELSRMVKKIQGKSEPDSFEQAVLDYVHHPINTDGFRSIEFKEYGVHHPRILLLGDSFTWGKSAMPLWNSFADRLLARGFVVFNTGIVCTDPAQYAAVAQFYVPRLKPDIVLVNYYSGNDNMYYFRDPLKKQWTYHFTNAGLLDAWPLDFYLTAEEAYHYHLSQVSIPQTNFINRVCASTVLTTRLWKLVSGNEPFRMNIQHPLPASPQKPEIFDKSISGFYIRQIKKASDEIGATMILSVIPQFKDPMGDYFDPDVDSLREEFTGMFGDLHFFIIDSLTFDDFANGADDHLNNAGAKKYADFLEGLIKNEF